MGRVVGTINSSGNNDTAELGQLQHEKVKCIQRAKKLAGEHDRVWKEEIRILAEVIEREYTLLGQDWLVSSISEHISKIYRDNDIKIWNNVYHLIDARFRRANPSAATTEQSSITSQYTYPNLPEQSFIENLKYTANHIGLAPRDHIADIIHFGEHLVQQGKKRAETEHIAVIPNTNSSFIDQTNDSKNHGQSQVNIDYPKPHASTVYDELDLVIKDLQDVRKRYWEFPPEILEKDEQYAAGWHSFRALLRPALDLKYSKSSLDWFKTEKYRDIYGKHAASVMSFSVTNLCANCSDEKTKEWVRMEPVYANSYQSYQCLQCQYQLDTICPQCNISMKHQEKTAVAWQCPECESTTPLTRDLTREQVGDKSSIIVDSAIDMLHNIPGLIQFCEWYRDWIEPRVGARKKRLSDDLSEKA